MKILIVEDDRDTAQMVRLGLLSDSHTIEIADNGADGSFMARSFEYDAIILDQALPRKSGIAVCREIRAAGKMTPVMFLSVHDDCETKVSAFEGGADDYMTKPFSIAELGARIRAVTRRPAIISCPLLSIEDLVLDCERYTVRRASQPIRLTRKEFNLLAYLMRNRGVVVSRALLMEHVWTADSDPFSNTVEAHIRNVRKKINAGGRQNLIKNIAGRGYVIDTAENLKKII